MPSGNAVTGTMRSISSEPTSKTTCSSSTMRSITADCALMARFSSSHTFVRVNQSVGTAIVTCHFRFVLQLGQNLVRQLFAQFYTHLIEAVRSEEHTSELQSRGQ